MFVNKDSANHTPLPVQKSEIDVIQDILNPSPTHNGIVRDDMPVAYLISKTRDPQATLTPEDKDLMGAFFREMISRDENGEPIQMFNYPNG